MLEVLGAHESVEVFSAHLSVTQIKKGLVGLQSWCGQGQKKVWCSKVLLLFISSLVHIPSHKTKNSAPWSS